MSSESELFFTSDTHFDHENILKYCSNSRNFKDVDEMNESIITNWNSVVPPGGIVWHLGDVIFAGAKRASLLNRLNGSKHLILGNHDKADHLKEYFATIHDYKEIRVNKKTVVLMHYPIASWNKEHYGSIHLHGHLHGGKHHELNGAKKNRIDVGVDCWELKPVSFQQIEKHLKEIT